MKQEPDPHTRTLLSEKKFRADPDEIALSERAAKHEGKSWNQFAREAIARRVRAVLGRDGK